MFNTNIQLKTVEIKYEPNFKYYTARFKEAPEKFYGEGDTKTAALGSLFLKLAKENNIIITDSY